MSKKIQDLPCKTDMELYGGIYSYWELENNVSDGFNRLKGKIYNLTNSQSYKLI